MITYNDKLNGKELLTGNDTNPAANIGVPGNSHMDSRDELASAEQVMIVPPSNLANTVEQQDTVTQGKMYYINIRVYKSKI